MMTNLTVPALYARAFTGSIPLLHYDRRLIIEVAGAVKEHVLYPRHAEKQERKIWLAANTYCYNAGSAVPLDQSAYRERLRSELNGFFGKRYGIEGRIEQRIVDMLELAIADRSVFLSSSRERRQEDIHYPAAAEGDRVLFRNASAQSLLSRIVYLDRRSDIPVINTVSSERIFTVEVPRGKSPLSDLEAWNVSLARVGLRLVRKMDHLDMLVIRSLNNQ